MLNQTLLIYATLIALNFALARAAGQLHLSDVRMPPRKIIRPAKPFLFNGVQGTHLNALVSSHAIFNYLKFLSRSFQVLCQGHVVLGASLSKTTPANSSPPKVTNYSGVSQPPNLQPLAAAQKQICKVKPLTIKVIDGPDGAVPGFLHIPQNYKREQHEGREKTAAILLSGAGGGVVGPSSIYLSIAEKIASLNKGIPVMRLDYRYPARNKYCVSDVQAAMKYLENGYAICRFVLVGWSFGGAPVFTVGGNDKRVVGCATVASQTADTDGIETLSPTPLLLLHGTADRTLSSSCSQRLYSAYGTKGDRKIHLFEGDDHALTQNSLKAEVMLCDFIMKQAGVDIQDGEKAVVKEQLVSAEEKIELMKKGGDLRGDEKVS